jgi:hypothetical protein
MEQKWLYNMSKKELIEKIIHIKPIETEKHLKRLPIRTLIHQIEMYRRYNDGITE